MARLLDVPNDPRWREAERRDIFLRGLLKADDRSATPEVIEAVRNEFRFGRSTVYRMIARFRASRKASSLIPADPRLHVANWSKSISKAEARSSSVVTGDFEAM